MARYFIDTEFFEGFHKPFLGKKRHFIDLISIGIVEASCPYDTDGDGNCPRHLKGCPTREYYAISNEFDLEKVWNNYDLKPDIDNGGMKKVYWLRENVLRPIWKELEYKDYRSNDNDIAKEFFEILDDMPESERIDFYFEEIRETWFKPEFTLKRFSQLIKKFGKSNKQIKQDIINFVCDYQTASEYAGVGSIDVGYEMYLKANPPQFFGYFADYDWCLFCSLFGRMIDLPNGFPMYMRDLKQTLDEKVEHMIKFGYGTDYLTFPDSRYCDDYNEEILRRLKLSSKFPKQENEHNALQDARFNQKLYEFLNKL